MLQEKKEQKQEKVDSLELTMDLIAECIYSVNKEAKRKRDIQEDCIDRAYRHGGFYEAVHYRLHRAKHEKASLYDLKERALEKAVRIWGLKPEGYHIFPDQPRDMYVIAGYSFHANKQTAENCIGMIGEEIPAERKRCIPPAKAILVLQRFIKE